MNRREFIGRSKRTALHLGAGMTILASVKSVWGTPANDRIVLAVIGIRGRGDSLAHGFASRDDCRIGYLCDVDATLFEAKAKALAERQEGKAPACVQDFRKALDDKTVDAIVVATPDHWHAPATVWSCQAGKDVYVEKPTSHSPWEGRQMVEAARKYKRVVQVGTQSRSAPYIQAAKEYIAQGKLGKIHFCRVYTMRLWGNFPMLPDADTPQGFDWDMWNGPAPEHKYNATFRNGWHHFWSYSGGDIINNGVHSVDLGRLLCGVDYPRAVYASGGRFNSQGAAETPDTQVVTWDFDQLVMTFELALYPPYMIKADNVIRNGDMFPYWPQNGDRVELYGEKGLMYTGPVGSGWQVYGRQKNREPVVLDQMYGRFPDAEHKEDFVQCVRSRKLPNADILEGHLSTLMCQYANISYRLGGQKLVIDPATEQIVGNDQAMAFFKRQYRKPYVVPDQV